MCNAVQCSFCRLASNKKGKVTPPSSVRVSRDSTAIANDGTLQAETFAGLPARPSVLVKVAATMTFFSKPNSLCPKGYE